MSTHNAKCRREHPTCICLTCGNDTGDYTCCQKNRCTKTAKCRKPKKEIKFTRPLCRPCALKMGDKAKYLGGHTEMARKRHLRTAHDIRRWGIPSRCRRGNGF
jgi:hypothetical protein